MKKPKRKNTAPVFLFAFLLATIPALVIEGESNVQIVRKNPETGQNTADATWVKPRPDPAVVTAAPKTQFSARIELGGQGGIDATETETYDFSTDSNLDLIQPVGAGSFFQVKGKADRNRGLDNQNQDYGGSLSFNTRILKIEASGGFEENQKNVYSAEDETRTLTVDTDADISGLITLGFLETLPITASYSHTWQYRDEDEERIDGSQSDSIQLTSKGTIGPVGLDLDANFQNERNSVKETDTTGFDSAVSVTIPIVPFFHIQPSITPFYTKTVYTETESYSETAGYKGILTLLFPVTEVLEFTLGGGRGDEWTTSQIGEDDPEDEHTITIFGDLGGALQPENGYFVQLGYTTEKIIEGLWTNNITASTGWREEEGNLLRLAQAEGNFVSHFDESTELSLYEVGWKPALTLEPVRTMTIHTDYSGKVRDKLNETDSETWTHDVTLTYDHQPVQAFGYLASAGIGDRYKSETHTISQDYAGKVTFSPRILTHVYTLSLGEQINLTSEIPEDDELIVNTATADIAVPIALFVKLQYGFVWEWVNMISPEEDEPGNGFSHQAGLTLAGDPLPFSFSALYKFLHGYKGERHDVTLELSVPFGKGFSIEGSFTLSRYEENDELKTPFLAGIFASYEY